MRNFRKVRSEFNARLLKAERKGRLEKELETIETEALRWWESVSASKKATRRMAR